MLECTKRQHWHNWLEKAKDPDIWMVHKYMATPAGDGGKCRIPVLTLMRYEQVQTSSTNEEKVSMLATSFFPPRSLTETPLRFVYPKPACKFDPITKEQIKRQLARLKPYKALGPDSIPNIVPTKCADILINRLLPIYKCMTESALYYAPWKLSTTVVLRKPGKP